MKQSNNYKLLDAIKNAKTKKEKNILLSIAIIGLTQTSKMPCKSYSIPAKFCKVGSKLRKVKNSVCSFCYACKGNYTRYPNIYKQMLKRYNTLKNPLWHLFMIEAIKLEKNNYFRWHDSGDIQDIRHLLKIVKIAIALPYVKFWLPTKEYKLIDTYLKYRKFPENLIVRKSTFKVGIIAKFKNNIVTSSINVNSEKSTKFNFQCPAYTKFNKTCGNCKACWNKNIINVNYPLH